MKADNFRLIEEVGRRRALWDSTIAMCVRREVGNAQWQEVSEIMQMDIPACKKRYKALRDSYRSEVRKIQQQRIKTSNWPYFRALEYLRDIFDPNKLLSFGPLPDVDCHNHDEPNLDDFIDDVDDDSFDFEIMGDIFKRDSTESQQPDSCSNLSDMKKSDYDNTSSLSDMTKSAYDNTASLSTSMNRSNKESSPRLLSPLLPKVSNLKRGRRRRSSSTDGPYSNGYTPSMPSPAPVNDQVTKDDPDYNFLVSLLPHVKSLSSMNNMKFRADVSRMLMDLNHQDMQRAQQDTDNPSASFMPKLTTAPGSYYDYHNEAEQRKPIMPSTLNGRYCARSSIIECDVKIENEPLFRD